MSSRLCLVALVACTSPRGLLLPVNVASAALQSGAELWLSWALSGRDPQTQRIEDPRAPLQIAFSGVPPGTYTFTATVLLRQGDAEMPLLRYERTGVTLAAGDNNTVEAAADAGWDEAADADFDHDGMSNVRELLNGLDPISRWTQVHTGTAIRAFAGSDPRFLLLLDGESLVWLGDQSRQSTLGDSLITHHAPATLAVAPDGTCHSPHLRTLTALGASPRGFYGVAGGDGACLVQVTWNTTAATPASSPSAAARQTVGTLPAAAFIDARLTYTGDVTMRPTLALVDSQGGFRLLPADPFTPSPTAVGVGVTDGPFGSLAVGETSLGGAACDVFSAFRFAPTPSDTLSILASTSASHAGAKEPSNGLTLPSCINDVSGLGWQQVDLTLAQPRAQSNQANTYPCGFVAIGHGSSGAQTLAVFEQQAAATCIPSVQLQRTLAMPAGHFEAAAYLFDGASLGVPLTSVQGGPTIIAGDDAGHLHVLTAYGPATTGIAESQWQPALDTPWGSAAIVGVVQAKNDDGSRTLFVATATGVYRTP